MTNTIGRVVLQQQLTSSRTNVNVKVLPTGLYYVTFKGESGTTVRKFVKI
ncbi:MAG: T9SS type A sorting domain-containing protein [Candidatus Paceibacterales bacterium]